MVDNAIYTAIIGVDNVSRIVGQNTGTSARGLFAKDMTFGTTWIHVWVVQNKKLVAFDDGKMALIEAKWKA